MNKYGGVLGTFNCQGAGWCKLDKKYIIHNSTPDAVSGSICANDIEGLADVAAPDWKGDCVVLSHRTRELIRIPRNVAMPITLQKLEYELFTVVPVEVDLLSSKSPIYFALPFSSILFPKWTCPFPSKTLDRKVAAKNSHIDLSG